MASSKLLLPLPDYQRIFRVIFSVLDGRAITEGACIFFAMVGAAILNEHYKLNARPFAGAAQFAVNSNESLVMTFGHIEDGMLVSTPNAFHCWVECEGFAIDFMAPIFQETFLASGHQVGIARRMFQKKLELMKPIYGNFPGEGAFSLLQDAQLTETTIENFSARHKNTDLANICLEWYKRPPKRISETLSIRDDLGTITKLVLHGPQIEGVW